jgi:hypothetical protein
LKRGVIWPRLLPVENAFKHQKQCFGHLEIMTINLHIVIAKFSAFQMGKKRISTIQTTEAEISTAFLVQSTKGQYVTKASFADHNLIFCSSKIPT